MRVKFFLLLLRGDTDFVFDRRIADRHKVPWLQVRSARCRPCRADAVLNYFAWHRAIGEIADRSPALHHLIKFLRAPEQFVVRSIIELRRGYQSWTGHGFSLPELRHRRQVRP